ncbi:MAG: DNA repair protein RecO, partial [Sphaerochaeta sp.]|nr:DNA repair protein RecO [Sphaerochaeta sp.]
FSTSLLAHCCEACASLDADLLLPPGARRYLEVTSSMDFEQSLLVPLSDAATLRIKRYLLRYAQMIGQRMLKTLSSPILWEATSL